jgi:CRP-like cAMP-binding protein
MPPKGVLPLLLAMLYSLLAASGLFFGAVVGVYFKPGRMLVASVMAFGAGALLSALAFELVEEAFHKSGLIPLIAGTLIGGLIFLQGNNILEKKGGFMRNNSQRERYIQKQKKKVASYILANLSKVDILRMLPPEEIHKVLRFTEEYTYAPGTIIFNQGDEGNALYIINSGEVNILVKKPGGRAMKIDTLKAGQTFGEMALITRETRSATAETATEVKVFRIKKNDFEHLLAQSPSLATEVSRLLAQRLTRAHAKTSHSEDEAELWKRKALASTDKAEISSMESEVLIDKKISKTASLAIFLGALIDGIPESAVIGATMVASALPSLSFLVAVFISNFPEAMSSASGLIKSGFKAKKVFTLWGLLILLSGIAAFLSNALLKGAPEWVIATADAIAAGGILAMLSNTMMPEAFALGGTTVALSTIAGFLCSFIFHIV